MNTTHEHLPNVHPAEPPMEPSNQSIGVPEQIVSRLATGEGHRAVELLVDSLSQGSWPAEVSLARWLRDHLDDRTRAKLISGFAHYPCFACSNGSERCDPCGGSGFTAVAQVCVACIGLGSKRCDFCNGAGLATYALVPLELRERVLVARAARASKYLQSQLQKRPRTVTETTATNYLQDINKLVGVLENAALTAKQLSDAGVLPHEFGVNLSAACEQRAAAAEMRIRETLQRLSRYHADRAATMPSVDGENARAKAEFYARLAQSRSFEGTGISHPFLSPLEKETD